MDQALAYWAPMKLFSYSCRNASAPGTPVATGVGAIAGVGVALDVALGVSDGLGVGLEAATVGLAVAGVSDAVDGEASAEVHAETIRQTATVATRIRFTAVLQAASEAPS
jgi:hypothetical protein